MLDIRQTFLDFFRRQNHEIHASAPLVPNDPTLLFTNAGMVQFKDIFTGKIPPPPRRRATSSQLCIRAGGKHNDLENVGYTARHHTLFEMLGNFSFGDYFKEEAIAFAWEFITRDLALSTDKIYASVHNSDDEAFKIWQKFLPEGRIQRFGDKDNFWQMGDVGPCGPCSEIYIDQGAEHFGGAEDYFGGEGDRFLEIWNLVFMQFERDESGKLAPLPKPSIDTGMGLERVAALLEGKHNNFDTSLFAPIIAECVNLTNRPYEGDFLASHRVVADHARSVAFLLAQGVNFDKEGRGYVLRRILRRALRHGYLLGKKEPFLHRLVGVVCESLGYHYDYLLSEKERIKEQCRAEEERFLATIEAGMETFKRELERTSGVFSGEAAFRLYDTFGFPLDLTQDMLKDRGLGVDLAAFEKCMQEQKTRARSAWKGSGDEVKSGDFAGLLSEFGENEFVGYERSEATATILALLDKDFRRVEQLTGAGFVLFDKTPLYAEGGGPVGDSGEIFRDANLAAEVVYTKKYFGLNISEIAAKTPLKVGEKVEVRVSKERREIAKHHSATHLLHAALREVLGTHITQAGSLVEPSRLRFDFTHPRALSREEIEAVEGRVNEAVFAALDAKIEFVSQNEAKNRGAMALFGEKYGDIVRMISFGGVSCELCGGIHIQNTAQVGNFYITKESGISSGVRRIEAVCGEAGWRFAKEKFALISAAQDALKNADILAAIAKLKENLAKLKEAKATAVAEGLTFEEVEGVNLAVAALPAGANIKGEIDAAKAKSQRVAVLLIANDGGKIALACGVKGVANLAANAWVKKVCEVVGGGGGGREDFATAGGKFADKINEGLALARAYAKEKILGG